MAQIAELLAKNFIEKKQALDNALAEVSLFKSLLDLCPIPVVLCDLENHAVMFVNQAYTSLTQSAVAEISKTSWRDVVDESGLGEQIKMLETGAADHTSAICSYRMKTGDMLNFNVRLMRISSCAVCLFFSIADGTWTNPTPKDWVSPVGSQIR